MTESLGQICWLPVPGSEFKELHWRSHLAQPWQHYSNHPDKQPDLELSIASKGMPTAQYLFANNWQYVSCENVLSEKPRPGSYYRHYKGVKICEVWAIAHFIDDSKSTEFVIYAPAGAEFKFENGGRSYLVADNEDLQHYSVDAITQNMTPVLADGRGTIAWARPLTEWMKPVEVDGEMRDRFNLVEVQQS